MGQDHRIKSDFGVTTSRIRKAVENPLHCIKKINKIHLEPMTCKLTC